MAIIIILSLAVGVLAGFYMSRGKSKNDHTIVPVEDDADR